MQRLPDIEITVLAVAYEQDVKFPPRGARLAASTMPSGEAVEVAGAAHGGLLTHPRDARSSPHIPQGESLDCLPIARPPPSTCGSRS